jgi:uncharacterized membrane protein HdeD (DUF308 family)
VPRDGGGRAESRVTTYRRLVQLLALLTLALGVAILIRTAVEGAGVGLLLGALFVAAGAGRLYLMRRRR